MVQLRVQVSVSCGLCEADGAGISSEIQQQDEEIGRAHV